MSITRIEVGDDGVARAVTRSDADDAAIYGPPPMPQSPAPPVFADISDRQCFQQLAIQGLVTQAEALQAVTVGLLPKAVTDGIAALPAAAQFPAQMLLCGATVFHRANPMVPTFMGFVGITASADIDAFWTAAALL